MRPSRRLGQCTTNIWCILFQQGSMKTTAGSRGRKTIAGTKGKEKDKQSEPTVPGLTTDEMSRWLSAARQIAVQCFGFIGTSLELKQHIQQNIIKRPTKSRRSRSSQLLPWYEDLSQDAREGTPSQSAFSGSFDFGGEHEIRQTGFPSTR